MTLETGHYTDGAFVKDAALGTYDFTTQLFTYADGVSTPQVTVTVVGQQMTINIDQLDTAVNMFYEVGLTAGHTYTNNAGVTYAPVTGDATDPNEGSSTGELKSEQSNAAVRFGGSGTASDDIQSYSLVINKTDGDGQSVAGATYQLEDSTGTVLRTDLVTDSAGQLRIGNLSAGTYMLVETAAPSGYQIDTTKHVFTVSAAQATANVVTGSVVDQRIAKTTLTVNKVWADVPAGVQTPSIEVTLQRNGQAYQTLQLTSASGYTGTFSDLDVTDVDGNAYTYTVTETAMAGYISSQTTNDETVTLTNTYQTGKLTVVKTDSSGANRLAGAVFAVKNAAGTLVTQLTTDATGQVHLTGLAQGTYTVSEIQAPDGYLINTQAQVIVLNEQSAYQGQLIFADEAEPSEPSGPSEPALPGHTDKDTDLDQIGTTKPETAKLAEQSNLVVMTQPTKSLGRLTQLVATSKPVAKATNRKAVQQLPQTSEQSMNWLMILGWFLLGLTVVIRQRRFN